MADELINKDGPVVDPEIKPEVTEVPKAETKTEIPEGDDDPQESAQAKSLYKALKDPRLAKSIISTLAEEHGLTLTGKETPKQERAVKKSVKDIVKSKLGDEYAFLADKLGDVIEESLSTEREAFNEKLNELTSKSAIREAEEAFEWLGKNFDDADKYENQIAALMDEFPAPSKGNARDYLESLYILAKHREAKSNTKEKLATKLKRNLTDPDTKLNGKNLPRETANAGKTLSLDEALAAASSQLEK